MAKEESTKQTVQKLAPLGARISPLKPSLTEIFATGKGEHMVKGKSYKVSEGDAQHLIDTGHASYDEDEANAIGEELEKLPKAKKGKKKDESSEE